MFLSSCYEPIEGCLDPLSSNFQLDADNACGDCCTYPSVTLRFFPMWASIYLDTINTLDTINSDTMLIDEYRLDTILLDSFRLDSIFLDSISIDSFRLDTVQLDLFRLDSIQLDTVIFDTLNFYHTNSLQQRLRIEQSQFFISNIYLTDPSGRMQSTLDSVILACDPVETLYNTLDIISLGSPSTQVKNIDLDFGYNSVQFNIGISECLATVDTIGLTSQFSTLENLNAVQISDGEYLSQEFALEFDRDNGIERIFSFINSEALVSLSIASALDEFTISRGSNLFINIDVNYDVWFNDLLSSDTEEQIKQKIIQNSISAFSLRN